MSASLEQAAANRRQLRGPTSNSQDSSEIASSTQPKHVKRSSETVQFHAFRPQGMKAATFQTFASTSSNSTVANTVKISALSTSTAGSKLPWWAVLVIVIVAGLIIVVVAGDSLFCLLMIEVKYPFLTLLRELCIFACDAVENLNHLIAFALTQASMCHFNRTSQLKVCCLQDCMSSAASCHISGHQNGRHLRQPGQ